MIVIIDKKTQIVPRWDSDESMEEINLVRKSYLQKCGCTKGCRKRQCSCVKNSQNGFCSSLCTCIGCVNKPEEESEENLEIEDFGDDLEDQDDDEDEDVNFEGDFNNDDNDDEGENLLV